MLKLLTLLVACVAAHAASKEGLKALRGEVNQDNEDTQLEVAKLCKMLNNDQTKEALTECRRDTVSANKCAEGILNCDSYPNAGAQCASIKNYVLLNSLFCDDDENKDCPCCKKKGPFFVKKGAKMIRCLAKEGKPTDGKEIKNIKKWHKRHCAAAEAAAAAAVKKAAAAAAKKAAAEAEEKRVAEEAEKAAAREAEKKRVAKEAKEAADKLKEEETKCEEAAAAAKDAKAKADAEAKRVALEEKKAEDERRRKEDEKRRKAAEKVRIAEQKKKKDDADAAAAAAAKYAAFLKITVEPPAPGQDVSKKAKETKVEFTSQISFIAGQFGTTDSRPYKMLEASEWKTCIATTGWMSTDPYEPTGKALANIAADAMNDAAMLGGQQCKLRGYILDSSKAGKPLDKTWHSAAFTRANFIKVLMTQAGVEAGRLCVEPFQFASEPKTDLVCGPDVCDKCAATTCKNNNYV